MSGQDLQGARLLAAPHLAAATHAPTPAADPKGTKGAAKADALGAIPATALAQLQQAAESCEAAMLKLSSISNVAGRSCTWPLLSLFEMCKEPLLHSCCRQRMIAV